MVMWPELRTTALFSSRRGLTSLAVQVKKEGKERIEMDKNQNQDISSCGPSHGTWTLPMQVDNWLQVQSEWAKVETETDYRWQHFIKYCSSWLQWAEENKKTLTNPKNAFIELFLVVNPL